MGDVFVGFDDRATGAGQTRAGEAPGWVRERPGLCRLMIYMKTTTIRVPAETRDRLNELARERGAPAGEVVDELVREADDRVLLAAAAEGWEQMSGDAVKLAAYRAEERKLASFDAPLADY